MIEFFAGMITASFIWIAILANDTQPNIEVVQHGCAEYNLTTGDFQWLKQP